MIKRQRKRLLGLFFLSDVLGILVAFFYSYGFRFYGYVIPINPEKGIPPLKSYIFVFPLFLIVHLSIFYIQGFYKVRLRRTKVDDFFFITLNAVFTILLFFAVQNYLYTYSQGTAPLFRIDFKISHWFLAAYFVVVIFLISFLRNQIYFFMKRRFAKGMNLQKVLVLGAGDMGKSVAQKLSSYKDLGFVVQGFLDDNFKAGDVVDVGEKIPVLGTTDGLEEILENNGISDVYVALNFDNYSRIMDILRTLQKHPVNVRLIPDLFQLVTLKSRVEDLDGYPVISIDEPPMRGIMMVFKRGMDVSVAATSLLLLSPLFLIVALLIKLTSRGQIFYHQQRIGLDGRKFIMHKFRTMVSDAEKKTGPVMCAPADPRITPVGRFLRKFSIDEFPQLFNVLRGEMSLVGPRPERPHFVQDFKETIPKYMLRHKVKSGVTGWAQVHGLRQDTPMEKRIEYDFYYIENWSLLLDIKILWKTLRKGFIDKSV
jgi:exopolysaccharide biosynthesis polyprenyl glycosylphosphotransferase